MKLAQLIEFLRGRLKAVKLVGIGLLVLVAALGMLLVSNEHAHTAVEHIPFFWSIFGFVGCVLIIVLSKWYGHLGIMTREDYYDDPPAQLASAAGARPSPGAATSGSGGASEHSKALDNSKPAAPGDGRAPGGGKHD